MVTWNMEFFHICNLKTFVKSFLHEILNTNSWETCVNFPTRNIEFAHRFHAWAVKFSIFPSNKFELQSSDMRFEILSLSHLTIWGEMFSYEIWILKFSHVKHFPYSSIRKIILYDSEIKAWAKWQTSNSYISCISQITHRIFCISLMKIWVRISLEEIGN